MTLKYEGLGRIVHRLSKETDYSTTHIRNLLKRYEGELGLIRKKDSNRWVLPERHYNRALKLVNRESGYRRILGEKKE